MEDIRGVVGLLPVFGEVGLDGEGAGPHVRPDLIPHQRAVGEAQRGIRPDVEGEMGIKVRRVIAAHPQDATAFGWPRCGAPEDSGTRQRPSGQGGTGDQPAVSTSRRRRLWTIVGTICGNAIDLLPLVSLSKVSRAIARRL
jgi:hypothetical protein